MSEINSIPLIIAGQQVKTGVTFSVKHPKTGSEVSIVHAASEEEVVRAIEAGEVAFHTWSSTPAHIKRDIFLKAAQLYKERQSEYDVAYQHDTTAGNLLRTIDHFNSYQHLLAVAGLCTEINGVIPQTMDGSLALITREPYGVCYAMTPFNFGTVLGIRSFAYAIACGNTVVWKANDKIPTLCHWLAGIFKEAGLPDGVLQVLQFAPGTEPALVERVISHPLVRHVNFCGSTRVGSIVGSLAGKYIKPVLLELGGNAPAVVLESADLKLAANSLVAWANMHGGQVCMSTARIIVVESVADQLVQELVEIAKGELRRLGQLDLATQAGVERMHNLVDDAVSKGATLLDEEAVTLKDPSRISYKPVILDNVDSSQSIYHEETFGPALIVLRAKDADDAVRIANDSDVGLSASVWTRDYKEALAVAKKIKSGAVHINSGTIYDEPALPHGGYKNSGHGRFNGQAAVDAFTQYKCITMKDTGALPLSLLL